jgi:2-dehydropantoate 2-reductase
MLIVGTGAMACLFAARLSAAGIDVTMLGTWPEGLEALSRYGVRVVEADGTEQSYPVRVARDAQAESGFDYALVLVKSWQTGRAAWQLEACLSPEGLALTLQNGAGNYELLSQTLGSGRVALGVTTIGANLLGPGCVRPAGSGAITLSEQRDPPGPSSLSGLAELLRRAGFPVEFVSNANGLLWGKLVINAAINPLTALLGVPNGELLEREAARALMAEVAREAAAVAASLAIQLPYDDPVAAVEAVALRTAANRSSMLQDVERQAPTEIEAICGAIVRAGEQASLPTPLNRTLWLLIRALSDRGSDGHD